MDFRQRATEALIGDQRTTDMLRHLSPEDSGLLLTEVTVAIEDAYAEGIKERDEARDLANALLELLYSIPPRFTRLIRDHGYNGAPCYIGPELERELNKLGIQSK